MDQLTHLGGLIMRPVSLAYYQCLEAKRRRGEARAALTSFAAAQALPRDCRNPTRWRGTGVSGFWASSFRVTSLVKQRRSSPLCGQWCTRGACTSVHLSTFGFFTRSGVPDGGAARSLQRLCCVIHQQIHKIPSHPFFVLGSRFRLYWQYFRCLAAMREVCRAL